MKLSLAPGVIAFLLAALTAAAPQRAAEAENHHLQRRDNTLEDEVDWLIGKESNFAATRQDLPVDVEYACHENSKIVSTNWLWEQTETKIDYLMRVENPRASNEFPEAWAGVDWKGWQDGEDGTKTYDWVRMVFTWDNIGPRGRPLTRSVLRHVVSNGISLCNVPQNEQPRTSGFAAKIGSDFVVYLYVAKMSSKEQEDAKKAAGVRVGLHWQTPDGVGDLAWDEFVRTTNEATELGQVKAQTLSASDKAIFED